jgi:hypothetical protein
MNRLVPRPAALLLLALALLLRLAPIDHGMPRTYVPDTHMVRNALGMLKDKDPFPPVDRYSSYPYLVPYALIPIFGAEYVAGRALGAWAGAGEFGEAVTADPRLSAMPARALMALCGALTALALLYAARRAELGPGAWAAAWLSATCLLNVQFSTQERPWAAVVCAGAFALWAAVAHEREGRLRSLLAAGAAAGLAFASHQIGAAFLALCGFAWAFAPGGWSGRDLQRRLVHGAACVAVFAAVGVLCGHGYYLVHGGVAQEAVVGGLRAADDFSIGGQALRLGFSLSKLESLALTLIGYDPILVVLGLVGTPMLFARRGTRAAGAFTVFAGVFFLGLLTDHVRYLLPLCLMLALAGGVAAERLFSTSGGALLAGVLLLAPLLQALRLDWVLVRTDTRAMAEGRLERLPEGSVVAIDHYGPTPDLDARALARLEGLRELRTRERSRQARLQAGLTPDGAPGVNAIALEELFGPDLDTGEYGVLERARGLGATPREVLERLGVTHVLLVWRDPGEPRPLEPLVADKRLAWVITPTREDEVPSEAWLPTEMEFPATGLWQVERPGPLMRLYELAPPAGDAR